MTPNEISQLFVPHVKDRRDALNAGMRLVHYTSAESAYRILSGREIWLRNAAMMNDFSEIQHGISCLQAALASPAGVALKEMLKRIKDDLSDELTDLFDGHAEAIRVATFVGSLSEHLDSEDQLGRLSMWRAYGGHAGVALVLNNTVFTTDSDEMKVYSSPVFYQDTSIFVSWFQNWVGGLLIREKDLHEMGSELVKSIMFIAFRSFALCTKHPGFAEEREWRVWYSPVFEGFSDWTKVTTEIVNGVPQHLTKLSLRDEPEKGVTGVAPKTLINRIIIGPCEHPIHIRAAIADAMSKADIENAMDKIWMSLIPLRQEVK